MSINVTYACVYFHVYLPFVNHLVCSSSRKTTSATQEMAQPLKGGLTTKKTSMKFSKGIQDLVNSQ